MARAHVTRDSHEPDADGPDPNGTVVNGGNATEGEGWGKGDRYGYAHKSGGLGSETGDEDETGKGRRSGKAETEEGWIWWCDDAIRLLAKVL